MCNSEKNVNMSEIKAKKYTKECVVLQRKVKKPTLYFHRTTNFLTVLIRLDIQNGRDINFPHHESHLFSDPSSGLKSLTSPRKKYTTLFPQQSPNF